jgi:hypothetical protein
MKSDGSWVIEMHSPMGKQELSFDLQSNGNQLFGAITGTEEAKPEITDGKIEGSVASWKLRVSKPMPVTLKFKVTIDGDSMVGKVKPGMFPPFQVTGRRN